jgi:DNA-directed RNA polymerase specialized sigma24 family protein
MTEPSRPTQPGPSADSVQLLDQARSGSRHALQSLLVRHLGPLRAFVRLQINPALRQRESESDLVQQVCIEVLQRGGNFEYRGESQFRGWLFGAVLNVVRDRERHHQAQRRTPARQLPPPRRSVTATVRGRWRAGRQVGE